MPELDLTDPAIRSMVRTNHQPTERWTLAGTLIGVDCGQCYQPWPCPPAVALRARPHPTTSEECTP